MISIIIRNKNEATALESILNILRKIYNDDIDEIIVVDNKSTDESIIVAEKFKCKIITIENFTYGKAINLGIENAKNDLVLLLSSHAVPIGNSFFKNSIKPFISNPELAGLRYINSYSNYLRAVQNDFLVNDGLKFGLMAGCAMVNKKIWNKFKFDEKLVFSEDKEWSERVIKEGYQIMDFNETFFYHIKRDEEGSLNRWKNETIAHYQLHKLKYPSKIKLTALFLFKIGFNLPKEYLGKLKYELKLFLIKLKLKSIIYRK
ncbi:glycosyltransferase family 2 protein [Flavobacterium sp. LC2016-12]|uniref:glycosyltransferase family 2 protein n=1 Tax=Flavobacterium sp. LC2016-12 TaxID=2783794 RepID=UPI00188CCBE4|nr:glycosyltransferase [Flavobacterium sp. LC2016-12]MBF4465653.1 glycosyltransferase [Flavobacterium sp. LC2016-12]